MKRIRKLPNAYLSALCQELGYILRSGLPIAPGVAMLRDDDDNPRSRALLDEVSKAVDEGQPLSGALGDRGCFPDYMIRMLKLAEKAGRMEQTLFALAAHYDRQREQNMAIRRAVMYPLLLLVVFLIVVAVLITQVLPIFDEVFRGLGMQLSSMAAALMGAGRVLSGSGVTLAVIGGIILLCIVVLSAFPGLRGWCAGRLFSSFGGRGIWGDTLSARFASALSIGIASGLDAEESIDSAYELCRGARLFDAKIEKCRELLREDGRLSKALSGSGVFTPRDSRMIAVGFETGDIDEIMGEIAARGERNVQERLDALVGAVEPIIVILSSVVAGVILLSVMLPLVGIMSGIG